MAAVGVTGEDEVSIPAGLPCRFVDKVDHIGSGIGNIWRICCTPWQWNEAITQVPSPRSCAANMIFCAAMAESAMVRNLHLKSPPLFCISTICWQMTIRAGVLLSSPG